MPQFGSIALRLVLAAALFSPLATIAWGGGDPARGERVFQRCYACHSVKADEGNLQGPSLRRILGRPAAVVPGFDYSEAMRQRASEGLVWDAEALDAYIADPDSVVPGTVMSIPPLRDAQDRADLIAYLAQTGPYQD